MAQSDYDALLDSLRELTSDPDGAEFTRSNLIALLDLLTTHLGEALATKVGELGDGTSVQAEHPVVAQLSGLASALRDLDKGLTDPVVKRIAGNRNASRPWSVRRDDETLIEGLEVYRRVHKIKDIKAAARKAAMELRRNRYTRRGKSLRWQDLYNLIYRH